MDTSASPWIRICVVIAVLMVKVHVGKGSPLLRVPDWSLKSNSKSRNHQQDLLLDGGVMAQRKETTFNENEPQKQDEMNSILESNGCRGSQCFGKREVETMSSKSHSDLILRKRGPEPCTGSQCLGRRSTEKDELKQEAEDRGEEGLKYDEFARSSFLTKLRSLFPTSYRGKRGEKTGVDVSKRRNGDMCRGKECLARRWVTEVPQDERYHKRQEQIRKLMRHKHQGDKEGFVSKYSRLQSLGFRKKEIQKSGGEKNDVQCKDYSCSSLPW